MFSHYSTRKFLFLVIFSLHCVYIIIKNIPKNLIFCFKKYFLFVVIGKIFVAACMIILAFEILKCHLDFNFWVGCHAKWFALLQIAHFSKTHLLDLIIWFASTVLPNKSWSRPTLRAVKSNANWSVLLRAITLVPIFASWQQERTIHVYV